jgi:hypothetical protein
VYIDGIPQFTEEQKLKYGIIYNPEKPVMKIKADIYNQEKLNERLNKLGAKEFKEWAEKEFGLDKKKPAKTIITEILKMQEEARR